ncbi:glycosyltransferase family 2 protein [Sediminispirochaeta smaragdinae]|uniref:Glycosyl transferase family 2 n=1 Tax=Sediminispirochaeta smaragdinae (strain DSM 11293 / JCM 15392 / SEBR 4228) TaxID=573413 RepID=E1RBU3_SEDSS|nr:glycosyltransferase [Sediminispirochaeta smaragdinae]ADK79823.1 glycosyl transferase family 2 [Sediminispirochaeta smaragdinae DSM 11293]
MDGAELPGTVKPMVSVVVPNYNYRRYLSQRLDSIIAQKYRDIEIIFLDDCSNDGSVRLAERFLSESGLPYTVEVNNHNSGSVFHQWAKGLELARGHYIWFAEADDFCSRDFLSTLLPVLEGDPDILLAYCDSSVVDEKSRLIKPDFFRKIHARLDPVKWNNNYINNGMQEIKENLFVKNTIPNASAVIMRTDALRRYGVYEDFTLSGDWMTYLRLLANGGKLAYRCRQLNYNRLHADRVTSQSNKSERYFQESRAVASFLLKAFDIPAATCKKYLENYLRQLLFTEGAYRVSSSEIAELERLFSSRLVAESAVRLLTDAGEEIRRLKNSRSLRFRRNLPDMLLRRVLRKRMHV